jgi:acyl-CoA thioester hydrolase
VEIEVRYVETDQMGVVHHSNYIAWFEIARTRLCQATGLHYSEIEELGYLLMVTGVHVKYRQGARYGDTVQVTARIERLWSRGVHYAYEVTRDGTLLATATTEHVWIDRETRKPTRLPADLKAGMERIAGKNELG